MVDSNALRLSGGVARVQVLDSGELLLQRRVRGGADGGGGGARVVAKRVGVRWLRRYYAQNVRPDDTRDALLAEARERRRGLGAAARGAGGAGLARLCARASYGQRGAARAETHAALALAYGRGARGESGLLATRALVRQVAAVQRDQRRALRAEQHAHQKLGVKTNLLQKNEIARSRSKLVMNSGR